MSFAEYCHNGCRCYTYRRICDMGSSYESDQLKDPDGTRMKRLILRIFKRTIRKYIPCDGQFSVLEIASGSGQHVANIAPDFPHGLFQPSENDPDLLAILYTKECANIKKPLLIDISQKLSFYNFKENSIDVIYNVGIISSYECTKGLFSNAGLYLKYNGIMITLGPYMVKGEVSPEGNFRFDDYDDGPYRFGNLPESLRRLQDLVALANENHLLLKKIIIMPSDMKCFVWIREGEAKK